MATIFQFKCPACAHEVESSGEPAALMRACTTPVLCLTCKEVHSAVTHSEALGNFPPGRGRAAPVKCPVNPLHRVVRWAPKYGCPKCAAPMVRSEHPNRFSD